MTETKLSVHELSAYLKPHAARLALTAAAAVVNVALTLLVPVTVGGGVDLIAGAGRVDFDTLTPVIIRLVLIVAAAAVFSWLTSVSANRAAYKIAGSMRSAALAKLTALPLSEIDGASSGDLRSRVIADSDTVCDGLLQSLSQFLTGTASILGTVAFMLSVSVPLGITVIVLTPLSVAVAAVIARATAKTFREQSRIRGRLAAYSEEYIAAHETVAVFGASDTVNAGFGRLNGELGVIGEKAQFASSLINPSTRFVNALVYAAAGIFGAVLYIRYGSITIGGVTAFLAYANSYTKPFNEISSVIANLQTAAASAARLLSLTNAPEEDAGGRRAMPANSDIEFHNVSFSYKPDRPLIRNLNLKVPTGTRVAIAGPTGCGKTTLINLLMRFYDVTDGSITLGGVDIRELPRAELRARFSMVLQQTWMCAGTVADNIAYGRPDTSDGGEKYMEAVTAAAKAVYADGFIRRLPDGYGTLPDKAGLSSGERQLIAIARAMLASRPALILDEATSSVDTVTESRIGRAFDRLMSAGQTSFTVAHRLSTIRGADLILVMRDGDIVERGSHEELMNAGGFYRELYEYGLG